MVASNRAERDCDESRLEFSASLPEEQVAVAALLRKAFPGTLTNSFAPDVMAWKYFSPHSVWRGPRSYLLKAGESIVAHSGIWPVHLKNSSTELKAAHVIDWAATPAMPGAGVLLLRRLAEEVSPLLTIGGSVHSRAILPKLGYERLGELNLYAMVVRPWLHFRSTPEKNWKTPLRFLRNAAESRTGLPSVHRQWHANRISTFDSSLEPLLEHSSTLTFASRRTIAGLNRLLGCPAAKFLGFVILESDRVGGFFLLSQVGHQTRIVDLQIAEDRSECWFHAFALAAQTAAQLPETYEITAGFSSIRAQQALGRLGFRLGGKEAIYCYDPEKRLGHAPGLELSLLDGDACFINEMRNPYLS